MTEFDKRYGKYLTMFHATLEEYCAKMNYQPKILAESMRYSLLLGGKRIRPVLMLSVSEMLGGKEEDVLPFAVALEMIHTYSLIHDDLPAMDNDDYRRGKLSNHKVFGEANAILAGDALLNDAFGICFEECYKGKAFIEAAKYLSDSAGARGMIAGQSADLLFSERKEFTEGDLDFIDKHKTGKLLTAAVAVASILSGKKYFSDLERFGNLFGALFQITDDILDVTGTFEQMGKTLGKDKDENKLTCVRIYGLEKSVLLADECAEKCDAILDSLDVDASFLKELVAFTRTRKK